VRSNVVWGGVVEASGEAHLIELFGIERKIHIGPGLQPIGAVGLGAADHPGVTDTQWEPMATSAMGPVVAGVQMYPGKPALGGDVGGGVCRAVIGPQAQNLIRHAHAE
jgi:hypothetical protein